MDDATARRLLGVPAGATRLQIEAAFRNRAMTTHPDRGGEPAAFRAVVEAHRILLHADRSRRPPPVTVVPDTGVIQQIVTALLRRLMDRGGPGRRVI